MKFRQTIISTLLFGVLAPGFFGSAIAVAKSDPTILDRLITEARANNPEIRAAKARWEMYQHKIVPAGSLNDPTLSFSFSNYPVDSFKGDEFAMSGKIVKFTQNFPFPGKLAARSTVAEEQSKWFKAVWEEGQLQLSRAVKDEYFQLYLYDKSIAITQKNLQLLDEVIHLTETNYEVGKGLQQDVLKAQVEYSKLADRLYTLRQQRESGQAGLNRLLARETTTEVAEIADLEAVSSAGSIQELKRRRPSTDQCLAPIDHSLIVTRLKRNSPS